MTFFRPRTAAIFVLAVSVCAVLAGCATEPVTSQAFFPLDAPTAWPEVRHCRNASADHDTIAIRVFAAPDTKDAYVKGQYPFLPGARLVKAEYDDPKCEKLLRFTAMRKTAAGTGNWEWQKVSTEGQILAPPKGCASCHAAGCAGRDHTCTDP